MEFCLFSTAIIFQISQLSGRISLVSTLLMVTILHATPLSLKCDYNLVRILKVKEIYKCIVREFVSLNKDDEITSVTGNHESNKTNCDVGVLILENQICHYLPLKFNEHFTNVYHLDVKNSSLLAVDQSTMKMFTKLKIIYLRGNLIEEIPPNLFTFNRLLEFINFDDNKIKKINMNAFNNLPNLVSISLERNICIDNFAMDEMSRNNLSKEIELNCI